MSSHEHDIAHALLEREVLDRLRAKKTIALRDPPKFRVFVRRGDVEIMPELSRLIHEHGEGCLLVVDDPVYPFRVVVSTLDAHAELFEGCRAGESQ